MDDKRGWKEGGGSSVDRGSDSRTGILGVDELKGFFFFLSVGGKISEEERRTSRVVSKKKSKGKIERERERQRDRGGKRGRKKRWSVIGVYGIMVCPRGMRNGMHPERRLQILDGIHTVSIRSPTGPPWTRPHPVGGHLRLLIKLIL